MLSGNFRNFVNTALTEILNPLLVVLVGLSLLAFIWGLAKFIYKSGDAASHAEGKKLMLWGLIALFVLTTFLGIIKFFYDDLGITQPFGIPLLPPYR